MQLNADEMRWLLWSNEHLAYMGKDKASYVHEPELAGKFSLVEAAALCKMTRARMDGPIVPLLIVPSDELVKDALNRLFVVTE